MKKILYIFVLLTIMSCGTTTDSNSCEDTILLEVLEKKHSVIIKKVSDLGLLRKGTSDSFKAAAYEDSLRVYDIERKLTESEISILKEQSKCL